MSGYNDIFKEVRSQKRLGLPFSADDITKTLSGIPDSVIIRIKVNDIDWIIIVSETSKRIKTTAIGIDSVTEDIKGMRNGYILHRSLPKPDKVGKRLW